MINYKNIHLICNRFKAYLLKYFERRKTGKQQFNTCIGYWEDKGQVLGIRILKDFACERRKDRWADEKLAILKTLQGC